MDADGWMQMDECRQMDCLKVMLMMLIITMTMMIMRMRMILIFDF